MNAARNRNPVSRDGEVPASVPQSAAGAPQPAWRRRCGAVALAVLLAAANFLVWRALNEPLALPDAPPRVAGLAYNGFQRWSSPLEGHLPGEDTIAADLRLLAPVSARLRTYSAAEMPALPALAEAHGVKLALGVWLDRRAASNEREIAAAIEAARRHSSVERVIVGNQTQLHGELSRAELVAQIARVRAAQPKPVSTAEPWHIWLQQPELARHVDFITVHLLPYWEGFAPEAALELSLARYREIRERFPRHHVVIGEIGWPSGGDRIGAAAPSPAAQAAFVRAFLARAAREPMDYFLMEAIDQPWKHETEGPVGAHWGLYDAFRAPKFALAGPMHDDPYWLGKAVISSLLGFAVMLPFLAAFAHMRLAGRLAFAAGTQVVASFAVLIATIPLEQYLRWHDAALLLALTPALAVMAAILLAQLFEFCELYWPGSLRRTAAPRAATPGARSPFVSIHLACSNEPPAMVIATLESLAALDWPACEVIVVDNNTAQAETWQPVRDWVERHAGEHAAVRFRFHHLPHWPGFKAGALNFALQHTDPRAEWVAVVDADYLVRPDWLRSVAGWLEDPAVGIVQAPQAHRDWASRRFARMMNWEYEGFFRIGMHHRHERDAIVQHGTMTLIRAAALRDTGGWDETCICEDTELGLRLLGRGYRAVYVDRVAGAGLVPADLDAYRRQRRRWAQGGMQILRRHAGALLGRSALRAGQRYHFIAGWLPWIGDALHLGFSFVAIAWTIGVLAAPGAFGLPGALLVAPLAVFFAARALLGPLLYARLVRCPARDVAGAALAGMALSHVIARGVIAGLARRTAAFEITRKGQAPSSRTAGGAWAPVREEVALLAGLVACIAALALRREPSEATTAAWMAVLGVQALPYLAAIACAALARGERGAARDNAQEEAACARTRGTGTGTGARPAGVAPSVSTTASE